MRDTVGIIGLGYIGLSLTAAIANVGYKVIGVDIDLRKIEALRKGDELYLYEPGLSETLKRCRDRIEFTSNYNELMKKSDVVLITICTPVYSNGNIDLKQMFSVITQIGGLLRKGQLIVLKSTVPPGTTRLITPLLEETSSLVAGKDFYVAYCPERTTEGLALHELYTLPKIVGGINHESTEKASNFFKTLGGKIITVSKPEVAELCKITDNVYRAMNIALANELGFISKEIGIDAYEMVKAVNKTYERTDLFFPGLGAGGPCLTKDTELLQSFARERGVDGDLISACLKVNKKATLEVALKVEEFLSRRHIKKPIISLLGLTFKGFPETDDVRNSPALTILQRLQSSLKHVDYHLKLFDPIIKEFQGQKVVHTIEKCLKDANVVVFLTNHPNLKNINIEDILNIAGKPLLIVDCWHNVICDQTPAEADVEIFRIGDGRL